MRPKQWFPFCALAAVVAFAACSRQAPAGSGLDLAAISKTAAACNDFYAYACGNYDATHPIPPDQAEWGPFVALQERNRAELRTLLETAAKQPAADNPVQRQVGDFYAACMDESRINQLGAAPLQPELDRIAALASPVDLAPEIAQLHADGADVAFAFGSDQDFKNADAEIAEFDQGGLGLPERDYYLNPSPKSAELRRQYAAHVAHMFTLLGETAAQADADAKTVLRMETALAQHSLSEEARRDPNAVYHLVPLAQFEALVPDFNWNAYFRDLGAPAIASVNLATPDFYRNLALMLRSTPLADWKVYLRWHAVHAAAPRLSQPFVDANFDFFSHTLTGQQQNSERWKRCVTATDHGLGEALGKLYVDAVFPPAAKQQMLDMVRHLEAAMGDDLRSVAWMSPATRQQALGKLAAITNKIGYPDRFRDYSSVVVKRDDYLGDMERAEAFEMHRQLAKIGKPVDRGEWGMTPPTVNAYYNPQWNEIVFPAGILGPPFFDSRRDQAVNYGAIGSVIGHELTHGFDDEGSQFDARGNLRDWWTPADSKAFHQREDCIADQYSRYLPLPDVHLNGKLTLGENTADNGGVRIAYAAMLSALDGSQAPVDGFTPPQRFFLGFAQAFCENVRPERERELAVIDPHSPGRFRVDGVVSNMPEFAQAFACKPDDAMTAKASACRVW